VVTDSGSAATARDRRRWRGLVVMLLAAFMDIVDTTVVLIAAPTSRTDLGASYADIQWVVAAYALALGLVLVTGGCLGDILGRKRLFLAGVAVFTAASAACALARLVVRDDGRGFPLVPVSLFRLRRSSPGCW
jgi:MFS family permease